MSPSPPTRVAGYLELLPMSLPLTTNVCVSLKSEEFMETFYLELFKTWLQNTKISSSIPSYTRVICMYSIWQEFNQTYYTFITQYQNLLPHF